MTFANQSVENAFFAYAKERTRISPLLLTIYLQKASRYCHLKQSILGSVDAEAVYAVQRKIADSKLLRIRFGKDAPVIRNVMQLYYAFVTDYSAQAAAQPEPPAEAESVFAFSESQEVILADEPEEGTTAPKGAVLCDCGLLYC